MLYFISGPMLKVPYGLRQYHTEAAITSKHNSFAYMGEVHQGKCTLIHLVQIMFDRLKPSRTSLGKINAMC